MNSVFQHNRQSRAAAIAQVSAKSLRAAWSEFGMDPEFDLVRGPEIGLVSLRGKIGGGGAPFPVGDATATRVSLRLKDGRVGHSMLMGRDENRAVIAAVVDALCTDELDAEAVDQNLMPGLSNEREERDAKRAEQAAATKVDFFTMVRGE